MDLPLSTSADGLAWPESPRWKDGCLWFSDVHNFRVMKLRPGGSPQVVAQVPGRPAGMGFMPDGRLLLASALDKKLWWVLDGGELELAVDLSAKVKGLLNDMVVDGTGRAWVGDTGFDLLKGEPERTGSLLSWAPGSPVRVATEEVLFPNGIAIAPDHRTLYLAETFGSRVSAFRMQGDGQLSERRVHAGLEGRPDGLCLDLEGALWVPLLWQQEFHRIASDGRITQRIRLEKERAISCVLAGPERRTLFLGVAEIDESDKSNVRRFGSIKQCSVAVPGAGIP
jgi:sugar lactone lactonase YvrE